MPGPEDTRQRILAAALNEFAQRGMAATTRAIAAAAGVNEVTLFRHFGSKQELANAVAAQMAAGLAEALEADFALPEPRQVLLALGRRFTRFLIERAPVLRLAAMQDRRHARPAGRSVGLRARLADYLAAQQRAGRMRPDVDPAVVAEAFGQALFGYVANYHVLSPDQPAPPLEPWLATLVEVFVSGLEVR